MKWSTREERQWVLCYTDRVCRTRDVVIMMILTLCPAGLGWCWWRPRSRLIGKFYKWGKWLAACEPGHSGHSGHSVHTDTRARLLTLPLRQVLGLLFAVSYLVTRVTLIYCVCIIITCTFHFHSDRYSGYWCWELNSDDPRLYIIHYTLYIQNPSMTITRGQGKVLCHILNTK